ncbi:HET-domain-containing protein, partial [Stipitochalara longipes BDJ]
CRDSHPLFRSPVALQVPTRLLELFRGGIRLCRTQTLHPSPLYLTLSHCWGKIETLKLKKDNIATFLDEIPAGRLSRTFKDVLSLTKALGFNYIWIDSLCIVQDDLEDWRKESALMSKVYGNSTLNIAATHAKDGNDGLFISRDTSFMSPRYLIESRWGKLYDLRDYRLYDRCINNAPLATRAWTIQERFLAPRTLHFTSEQIFYECNQVLACETWPEGLPNRDEDDLGRDYLSVTDTAKFPKSVDDEGWVRIIDQYSKAQLTFGKDKLTAFSGITRLFVDRTGNEYVAGLCRKILERQLCWSRNVYISNADRAWRSIGKVYKAPSWSWASID